MKYLDLTLSSAEANLACDEALLDQCDESGEEFLRFWEPQNVFAVLGYANKVAEEVFLEECSADNVAVLRRCSGGGTVLQGPGCLNYSVVLSVTPESAFSTISSTNKAVMGLHRTVFQSFLGQDVQVQGYTDLTVSGLKFSGNAQRRKRRSLIFHGTFLLQFDLSLIGKYLKHPPKEPEYRMGRKHGEFLRNINVPASSIKLALRQAWNAAEALENISSFAIESLVKERYARDEWNLKF